MIGHDFHLDDCVAVFSLLLKNEFPNSAVHRSNQHFAPILWAKDYVVFATVYNSSITVQFVRYHTGILI